MKIRHVVVVVVVGWPVKRDGAQSVASIRNGTCCFNGRAELKALVDI
jgi:hypothetical protein